MNPREKCLLRATQIVEMLVALFLCLSVCSVLPKISIRNNYHDTVGFTVDPGRLVMFNGIKFGS